MKQKTKKAASKRFRFSARGKVLRRAVRQAHFNGKETGNETRRKHPTRQVDKADLGRIQELVPYQNTQ
ncbi:MAG: 50S ribosomal protein L35 [Candidatus Andersenbacteria bacterium CG10_big_fil_rev_8_21_14_0_10_54_11]|uniref:50S ribosomal protein L35 n=1 Tax=Candidatus Andersenbacteria bacterium CG10_big_fil_rev_8_21_14_0_10_54_11 TaxID=1974485 RepID=A0A2M6X0L0_9BACT|nr:MAG: 50S ribosomal protein L35 [Candidatus Andersenbacteria bacterium CG10_big_fil_rev_8_21_14_0_10_54_11]